jgi:hypothetical protein
VTGVLLLTERGRRPDDVLPALRSLPYSVHVCQEAADPCPAEAVLVDARSDLVWAKARCRSVGAAKLGRPLLAIFNADGLVALSPAWMVDDVVLPTACPNEVRMRLRLAAERHRRRKSTDCELLGTSTLRLDQASRTARLCDRQIRLTYAEFEILACLARKPGQVVTHSVLLDHLYEGEPRGTTRAIQTHIRRIRAKLGPDHAGLIQTSHGIGYRLDPRSP